MFNEKVMLKVELAQKYFPHLSPRGATNRLWQLMKADARLMADLKAINYNPYCRYFTRDAVEIITKWLGAP